MMERNDQTPNYGNVAEILDLAGLFQRPISYRIPQFQRACAWKESTQWEPLWGGLRSIMKHRVKHGDLSVRPHFMGAIVLQRQASGGESILMNPVPQLLVVDEASGAVYYPPAVRRLG